MSRIVVLGAGMVGRAIAADLGASHEVVAVDRDPDALDRLADMGLETREADLSERSLIKGLVSEADLVISAVPGFMGFRTLEAVIEAGRPAVDISFMPEPAADLDVLAKDKGVTVVVDMGVAPGMDNLILGFHDARMQVHRFECLVGGLPRVRSYPFEYKAPFSPIDVIEEYTRPARYVSHGETVTLPALSEPELVEIPPVGTLEAFNTDGLRSLIHTMPHIPEMKEKTLRYQGHRDLMAALAAGGFFSPTPIDVGDQRVSPLAATAAILLKSWQLDEGEPEFTVMRVTVEGRENDQPVKYVYSLYDEYDPVSGFSSMARTTGFACTAVAELLLRAHYESPGVSAPEQVGRADGCMETVMEYLEARNVHYPVRRQEIAGQESGRDPLG